MSKEKLEKLIKDAHYSMSAHEYFGGMLINNKRKYGETPEYEKEMKAMIKNYYTQLSISTYAIRELAKLKGVTIDLNKPGYLDEVIDFDLSECRITSEDMLGFSHILKDPLAFEELHETGCIAEFMELVRFHAERIEDELMIDKLRA